MFQATGFQVNAFQQGGVVVTPVDTGRGERPAGRSRRRRRYEVEIDGEVFEVASVEEAEALLEQVSQQIEQQAKAEAERVIRKRQVTARRNKTPVNLKPVLLDAPTVRPVEPDASLVASRIQATIDAIYARAARDAELALRMQRQLALDEEDAIILVLLSE